MNWTTVLDEIAESQDVVRVLLVEDEPGDRRLVEEMLREADEGAVLTSCTRLGEALGPISRGLADLVLLDLSLPDSFGIEGVRRLRAAAPDIPVVVLSGNDDKQVALEAVQAGAQDYLTKDSVDGETLTKAMRYAMERQRTERRLVRLALSDPLTGLTNRILFADRLEQALARAARSAGRSRKAPQLLLMFIDLDGFKAVNDKLGHLAGDEVLVEVARRLDREVRESDTVARLGGDEFVVLCEGVQGDGGVSLARRLAVVAGGAVRHRGGTGAVERGRRGRDRRSAAGGRGRSPAPSGRGDVRGQARGRGPRRGSVSALRSLALRVSEAAATMPSFVAAVAGSWRDPHERLGRIPLALREGRLDRVWRDGAAVEVEPRVAVALPGSVFPLLGDYEELRARDPASFTAPEVSGATFTVWGLDLELDWLTPPLLPRQTGALGVGRAGLTLVADARVATPQDSDAFLAALMN